uniref:Uncharacterized protein n=1 Tax=Mycena chlorophos TaxID=658473 RepID=A0ABQ0LKK4_MYCCL|nr:predicted protein [Mycena chlorophos]
MLGLSTYRCARLERYSIQQCPHWESRTDSDQRALDGTRIDDAPHLLELSFSCCVRLDIWVLVRARLLSESMSLEMNCLVGEPPRIPDRRQFLEMLDVPRKAPSNPIQAVNSTDNSRGHTAAPNDPGTILRWVTIRPRAELISSSFVAP